jgi:hypothetical protein
MSERTTATYSGSDKRRVTDYSAHCKHRQEDSAHWKHRADLLTLSRTTGKLSDANSLEETTTPRRKFQGRENLLGFPQDLVNQVCS